MRVRCQLRLKALRVAKRLLSHAVCPFLAPAANDRFPPFLLRLCAPLLQNLCNDHHFRRRHIVDENTWSMSIAPMLISVVLNEPNH